MNNQFFDYLDLPSLPDQLVEICKNYKDLKKVGEYRADKISEFFININGERLSTAYTSIYEIPTILQIWIKEKILPKYNFKLPLSTIQVLQHDSMTNNLNIKYGLQPHIDGYRGNLILNYFIETGGDYAETFWAREPNFDINRTPENLTWSFNKNFNDYTFLKLECKTKIEKFKWILMKTYVLHGMSYISKPRISISLVITQDDLLTLNNFHKNIQL